MRRKGMFTAIAVLAAASALMGGCGRKDKEPEAPVEQTLTPVTVNDLKEGSYYVKNGAEFYELPSESVNFDLSKAADTTTRELNGIISDKSRIADFVYKDGAIPTLYKNDQLVFKASGNVPSFTWERFIDQGYSIGLYGLQPSTAGKVQFVAGQSGNDATASFTTALSASISEGMSLDNGFVIDKVNGASLTDKNLRTGGIIAGLTKDAIANCDIYVGTSLISASATADMRAFTSFELYTTDLYSNSPDGYAIIDIPAFLKSGYYWINNAGMVKYYNVDRGADTTGISLDEQYYYEDGGKVLTYYEYMEQKGAINQNTEIPGGAASLDDTPDVMDLNTDATQPGLSFDIAYKYQNKEEETTAKQNGTFPRVVLVSPTGNATDLAAKNGGTDDEWMHMNGTVEGAVAGTWQLRFYNFEHLYRQVSTGVSSGNAKSFVHSGTNGRISIHFDASASANDITVTWQNADRAADITIRTPEGTEYSKKKTPGNIMLDEYGKVVFKLPSLTDGDYEFNVSGKDLGRVWIDSAESVSLEATGSGTQADVSAAADAGTAPAETAAAGTEALAAEAAAQ